MSTVTPPTTGSTTSGSSTQNLNTVPKYTSGGPTYVDKTQTASQIQGNFIKLLTAQIQYQDPSKPMDNAEVTNQMAQLNSLQQGTQTNALLQQLVNAQTGAGVNQAVGYLGKQVVVDGNTMSFSGGKGSISFELSQAANATITVFGPDGQKVKWMDAAKYQAGANTLSLNDPTLPDGNYTFQVSVTDPNASDITVTPKGTGVVSGVVNDPSNGVMLLVGNLKVKLDKVLEVKQPAA